MKIVLGPYKSWVGPYQIAEKIMFWKEHDDDAVYKFGEWLAGKNDDSVLTKVCTWIEKKRKRNIKVRIDYWDTWSMDHTLAIIILPMLKQLKATKHGSFMVDDEDVPERFRIPNEYSYSSLQLELFPEKSKAVDEALDEYIHLKCDWVLDEMIWAFEQLTNDENDSKFFEAEEFDRDAYGKHHDRIKNGLTLFGKYYRGLWD